MTPEGQAKIQTEIDTFLATDPVYKELRKRAYPNPKTPKPLYQHKFYIIVIIFALDCVKTLGGSQLLKE